MTGLERNSDIVFAASYAPLLGVCWFHRELLTGLRADFFGVAVAHH